jgi:hypothetical protein
MRINSFFFWISTGANHPQTTRIIRQIWPKTRAIRYEISHLRLHLPQGLKIFMEKFFPLNK